MQTEIWKNIPNYEGLYQVSNFGRVKSLSRIITKGIVTYRSKEIILKGGLTGKGYLAVILCKDKIRESKKIHILVAECFLGHIPCGFELIVDHVNENDKTNNRLDNLQIITTRENVSKSIKNRRYTSEYIGVNWNERAKKWRASILIERKYIHLGTFSTEKEASEYYQNALLAYENGEEIVIKRRKYTSKHKGVCFDKRKQKWIVTSFLNGKKYLGGFKTEIEAIEAIEMYQKELNKLL